MTLLDKLKVPEFDKADQRALEIIANLDGLEYHERSARDVVMIMFNDLTKEIALRNRVIAELIKQRDECAPINRYGDTYIEDMNKELESLMGDV